MMGPIHAGFMDTRRTPPALGSWLLLAGLLAALHPAVSPGVALAAGLALALGLGHGHRATVRRWTPRLLALSVAALGADLDLGRVLHAGLKGAGFAFCSILFVLGLGLALIRLLGVDRRTGLLVSVGTAICGGSAIAAAAPVLDAEEGETGLALATVFLLNAVALWVFPLLGHLAGLAPATFGLWAALGIHDTSSVVGAALAYGGGALEVATTTKLARALWIVPLTLLLARLHPRQEGRGKAKRPWFILGFLAAAALCTWIPALRPCGHGVAWGARRLLVLTLFLVGAGLDRETLARVGWRPALMGVLLWGALGLASFTAVSIGWARP